MECLSSRREPEAPGGGRAKIENSSRRHPRKFGQKRFLAVRRSWRGKWGGLFWATSLEKIFGGTTTLGAAKGRAHRVARSRQGLPHSLRHLRSSLPRRYHPADSNCERIRSELSLDFMKQHHSPLLRSGPPV